MIPVAAQQDDVERLASSVKPAWIFKHSTRCEISSAALVEVQSYHDAHPDEAMTMILVPEQRPLSNWAAQRLGRVHQSPQLFLVAEGVVVWAASHWSITAVAMEQQRARLSR